MVQAVLELFKLLLVALSAAPSLAPGTDGRLMHLLVPLLVAALAPVDEKPHAAIAGLALQMIQRLAAGPASGEVVDIQHFECIPRPLRQR